MTRINVEDYLIADGIPTAIKGFGYLIDAIMMYHQDIGITTELYPAIAKKNDTTPKNVEKAMRRAVSKNIRADRISNSEYISFAHLIISRKKSA